MRNDSKTYDGQVQSVISVITLAVLLFFSLTSVYPMLNMKAELWSGRELFPVIQPIGTDFREGLFYPAKVLLAGKSPYVDYSYGYPPMAVLFAVPFRLFNVQSAYLIHVAILFALTLLSVWQAINLARVSQSGSSHKLDWATKYIRQGIALPLAMLAITSYGFLFSVERGNYDIYTQLFMLLGILALFTKPDRIWLQVLLFSIAAHLKLYPAILFILPLWKHGAKSLLPLAVVNVLLLFIIGPFNAVAFINRMSAYIQVPFLWVGNQSAASFAALFNHSLARWTDTQVPGWFFALLPLLVWAGAAYFCWRRKYSHESVLWMYAISVPVMNLLPSTSHDYKLVLLYAPLAIVLYFLIVHLQKTGRWANRMMIGAMMVLALLLSTSYTMLPDILRNKYPFVFALQILFFASMLITSEKPMELPRLKLLPVNGYVGVNRDDPIRLYSLPIIGRLYQQRVEYCLAELASGTRVLEIGFGSGVSFFNLREKFEEIHGLDLTASTDEIGRFFQERGIETHLKNGSVMDMPYPDDYFDTVLLVSILEHLKPGDQKKAFSEIARVLKPGGQVVYGVPVERPIMVFFFRLLGADIRQQHFSTETDVAQAARETLMEKRIVRMSGPLGIPQNIYQIGHFIKR